jgi:hypothetical protein
MQMTDIIVRGFAGNPTAFIELMKNEQNASVMRNAISQMYKFYPEKYVEIVSLVDAQMKNLRKLAENSPHEQVEKNQWNAKVRDDANELLAKVIPSDNTHGPSRTYPKPIRATTSLETVMLDFLKRLNGKDPNAVKFIETEAEKILANDDERMKYFPGIGEKNPFDDVKDLKMDAVIPDGARVGTGDIPVNPDGTPLDYNKAFEAIPNLERHVKKCAETAGKQSEEIKKYMSMFREFRVLVAELGDFVHELCKCCSCNTMKGAIIENSKKSNHERSQYFCAMHKGLKNDPAVDYALHSLAGVANSLGRDDLFLAPFEENNLDAIKKSMTSLSSMARRLARIFEHAGTFHEKIFDTFESRRHLAERFLNFEKRATDAGVVVIQDDGERKTIAAIGKYIAGNANAPVSSGDGVEIVAQHGIPKPQHPPHGICEKLLLGAMDQFQSIGATFRNMIDLNPSVAFYMPAVAAAAQMPIHGPSANPSPIAKSNIPAHSNPAPNSPTNVGISISSSSSTNKTAGTVQAPKYVPQTEGKQNGSDGAASEIINKFIDNSVKNRDHMDHDLGPVKELFEKPNGSDAKITNPTVPQVVQVPPPQIQVQNRASSQNATDAVGQHQNQAPTPREGRDKI